MVDNRITRRRALAALGASALAPLAVCSERTSAPSAGAGTAALESAHWMTLQDISQLIASRAVSPVALMRHLLDRIRRVDPNLQCFATVMEGQAMAAATEAEREINAGKYRGPLHGVPVAVKDLCYTRGVRTMGGTKVLRDFVPDEDATVVARMHEAGAVLLGKLNLTEGAMGGYSPSLESPSIRGTRIDGPACRPAGQGWRRRLASALRPSAPTRADRFAFPPRRTAS